MLEFYLIGDDQPKPGNPKQLGLSFAGGLEHECFENLKTKGFIADRF